MHTHPAILLMGKLDCSDYGFECGFVAEGENITELITKFGRHSSDEHGIDYPREALMLFIIRQGIGSMQ